MSGEKYVVGFTKDVAGIFKAPPDVHFPGIFDVSVEAGKCVAIFLNRGDSAMAEKCAAALNSAEKTVTSPNTAKTPWPCPSCGYRLSLHGVCKNIDCSDYGNNVGPQRL